MAMLTADLMLLFLSLMSEALAKERYVEPNASACGELRLCLFGMACYTVGDR